MFGTIYGLLSGTEKKSISFMVFAGAATAMLDLIGLSAILPGFVLISRFDEIIEDPRYSGWHTFLGEPSRIEALNLLLVIILVFFAFKSVVGFLNLRFQYSVAFKIRARLSVALFNNYLSLDYKRFKSRSVSDLLNMIANEVNVFTGSIVLPFTLLISDFIVIVATVGFLLFNYFNITILLTVILSLTLGLLLIAARGTLPELGRIRQKQETRRINIARECFNAFREVRILALDSFFVRAYSKSSYACADAVKSINLIAAIPRFSIELILVLCVVSIVFALQYFNFSSEEVIPMVIAFLLASSRLMPAFARLTGSIQSMRSAFPSVERLVADLAGDREPMSKEEEKESLDFRSKLELSQVDFSYDGSSNLGLHDVNLCIRKGNCYGIRGESGAGKSTLVEIIAGLLQPTSGVIKIDNQVASLDRPNWHEKIALVTQSPALFDATIAENIGVGDESRSEKKLNSAIRGAGLQEFIAQVPGGWDYRLGDLGARLSGGQKQRIGIARALYLNKEFLIFDEPTSALDVDTRKLILHSLQELKKSRTVLIISHDSDVLNICDFVIDVKGGSAVMEKVDDV